VELLARFIDHAPLFPPASLDMEAAVAEDRRARASEHAWMLGRFVCPASRLAEVGEVMGWDGAPGISVVLDGGEWEGLGAPVEALEVRVEKPADLPRHDLPTFYEIPLRDGWRAALAAVAAARGLAKIRCGGAEVPSVEQVAAFIAAARAHGVAFKATAGLHHPVTDGGAHGFLNFLLAAERATEGCGEEELRRALTTRDPKPLAAAAPATRELFLAIGSCSFSEPVEDLQALGIL